MTTKEYQDKIKQENLRHLQAVSNINVEYAMSNNPYHIGDIITDHIGSGRIRKIRVSCSMLDGIPCCVYICDNLTTKMSVNKKEPVRNIFQINIK